MLRENAEYDELPCMKRNTSGSATTLMAAEMVLKRVVRFTSPVITYALLYYVRAFNNALKRIVQGGLAACTSRYANGGIGGY